MNSISSISSRPQLLIADHDPVVQSVLGNSLGEHYDIVGVTPNLLAKSVSQATRAHAAGRGDT